MKARNSLPFLFIALQIFLSNIAIAKSFKHFDVAIYTRAQETKEMADIEWLESHWEKISPYLHVDHIYLETYRDEILVDGAALEKAKAFFKKKGIKTSGGITLTIHEPSRFQTFCYSDPEHRKRVKEIAEHTARHFNEIILDDFYFTNCKCHHCIKGKGDQSWTDYRIELLAEAAQSLIINPAKKVNPKVKVTIKYPNWYEHFQGLGFNLEKEPGLFDALYTGTETRDPSSAQHLQPYLGYLIFRYFEHLKPGANQGGWVDVYGIQNLDRYAEQLWITMFAKAPEITLFNFRDMARPFRPELKSDWQCTGTSFDYDEMVKPVLQADGTLSDNAVYARAAGYSLQIVDDVLVYLGEPVAINSYKPFHSLGEDFLHNYFGMIGIPVHLKSQYPSDDKLVLLTETAKYDPEIVQKIKTSLVNGNKVIITSGLLSAIQEDIADIAELRYTKRKALVKDFKIGWFPKVSAEKEMLIPQINYLTNDSWEEISALDETNGWPLLHSASYSEGVLYVLTIPESFTDLYHLPDPVLNGLRRTICPNLYCYLEGPSKISLFMYDNNTVVVESFRDEPADIALVVDEDVKHIQDCVKQSNLDTGEVIQGWRGRSTGKKRFKAAIKPHSFRVFKLK